VAAGLPRPRRLLAGAGRGPALAAPATRGLEGSFHTVTTAPLAWFSDGQLDVSESCLDRHLADRGDQVAILWEGDEPGDVRRLTYRELHAEVIRAAAALRRLGLHRAIAR